MAAPDPQDDAKERSQREWREVQLQGQATIARLNAMRDEMKAKGQWHEPKTDAKRILDRLNDCGQKVWGFKVYRLTYEDDIKWKTFMETLQRHVNRRLTLRDLHLNHTKYDDPEGLELVDTLDLAIENDKAKWDGASFDQVREHFKQWADAENPKGRKDSRYNACVAIDKESLESIINSSIVDTTITKRDNSAFVNVVDKNFDREVARKDHEEHIQNILEDMEPEEITWPVIDPDDPEEQEAAGYMKVAFRELIPSFYDALERSGFSELYHEHGQPPRIWTCGPLQSK